MQDLIVKVIARFMMPFIQLYGLYIITHGHLSPGGGFAGGTIIAASLILYTVAFGLRMENMRLPERWGRMTESGGALSYVFIALLSIPAGVPFFSNAAAGFPLGIPGRLLSGGSILILTLAIGLKVASTMITLFSSLAEKEGS